MKTTPENVYDKEGGCKIRECIRVGVWEGRMSRIESIVEESLSKRRMVWVLTFWMGRSRDGTPPGKRQMEGGIVDVFRLYDHK